ncbi:MAG TPA: LCP family protein [Solirubrobacteraceae bacterium]|nr:LCP family protein [Solirubrobacteraceae bacterium]
MSAIATPPPVGRPPRATPPLPPIPPEPPRRPWWLAGRVLAGGLGIVLLVGAASALLARNEVSKVVAALRQNKAVKVSSDILPAAASGAPETLLLVGNDERPPPKSNPYGEVLPHSNEMLLVRIDPSKPTISMLSIPRELRVPFTRLNGQLEENRINSAYTFGYEESGKTTSGGVKLMVETLTKDIGITPNLVFVTNFKRFKRAVDEMGCVYITVDKRYHHINEPGGEQYFEINLQPGYQRLCGEEALEFVANRHESTSLIRDARDQRFLLAVKAEYGPTLFENREKFEHVIGKAVETDLRSEAQVLQLLELLVESAGKPVRQVPFHVELHATYDTATPQEIQEAVHSFLSGTAAIAPHRLHGVGRPAHTSHRHTSPRAPAPAPSLGLSPTSGATLAEARAIAPRLPFAVQAPRAQAVSGESEPDTVRRYDIRGPGGQLFPSYVIVVDQGELGQFYDIQGSSWTDSPLLSHPTQEIPVGGRTDSLYYDGEHLKTIAWREGGAAYWIENTLTNNLSPQQMLAIAEQTHPVIGSATAFHAGASAPRGFKLPPPAAAAAGTLAKVGALLGFVGLAVVVALAIWVLVRQRELRALREQVAQAMALEARGQRRP